MEYPLWVMKHKQKGTEVRKFGDKYYLYKITSVWDKEKKRAKKVTLAFLGKITEKGLIKPRIKLNISDEKSNISTKEFGGTQFLIELTGEIRSALEKHFPEYWREIITLSYLRILYQSPLKNMKFLYENSFLSNKYENLKLGSNDLTILFRRLGEKRENIVKFMKSFLSEDENILFDATHIFNQSSNLGINQLGYNSSNKDDLQINLLYAFSETEQAPSYYRILPGNVKDVRAFKLSLEESGLRNAIIVADKGFYSEKNVSFLDEEKFKYILPLRRNNKKINYTKIRTGNKKEFTGNFLFENRVIWYVSKINNGKKIVTFLDERLKTKETEDYFIRIENNHMNYTKDDFHESEHSFGTLSILTNLNNSALEFIYKKYKSRLQIETMFDALKNTLESDKTYMRGERELESWFFINHISLICYYKIYKILIKNEILKRLTPKDLLLYLSLIKKIRINNTWVTSEIPTKVSNILKKIDTHIT